MSTKERLKRAYLISALLLIITTIVISIVLLNEQNQLEKMEQVENPI